MKIGVAKDSQWKRAGPITQSSEDHNLALLPHVAKDAKTKKVLLTLQEIKQICVNVRFNHVFSSPSFFLFFSLSS